MKNGMTLIKEHHSRKLLDQLYKIPFNTLFARAILESKALGKVFVDNEDNPKTILIAHSYGMSLLFGDTENLEFNISLADYMLNVNGDRLKHEWLQVYPQKWNDKLREILNGKIINYSQIVEDYSQTKADMLVEKHKKSHVIQWVRVNFIYKNINKVINTPPNPNIELINSDIYDKIQGTVIPNYFWNSKEAFLSDGVGYVLMNDSNIVSLAFSSCKFENVLEIGVETSEIYRGVGFAKQVCEELLVYCAKNNYSPIWACRKENTGSYMLAKSLGFEEALILPYYELVK